jgi:hypothetical protein
VLTSKEGVGSGLHYESRLIVRPDAADGLMFEVVLPEGAACLVLHEDHVRELYGAIGRWLEGRRRLHG